MFSQSHLTTVPIASKSPVVGDNGEKPKIDDLKLGRTPAARNKDGLRLTRSLNLKIC
jgi:hypothetical protein